MKINWGHGIIIFFVIFFIWIISFVIFSLSQNNDLVTKDYYKKGADYSLQMEINKRSKIYKDSIWIENRNNEVIVCISPLANKMASNKMIIFYRPSGKNDDLKLGTDNSQDTVFIPKSILTTGRYHVKYSWEMDEQKYEVVKEFIVK